MTKLTYSEQLAHPNWQRKRLDVLSAADFKCEHCNDAESTLHVHHRHYIKGRLAWEYECAELQVLCRDCHTEEHGLREHLALLLTLIPTGEALAFIGGVVQAQIDKSNPAHVAADEAAFTESIQMYQGAWLGLGAAEYLRLDQIQALNAEVLRLRDEKPKRGFDPEVDY